MRDGGRWTKSAVILAIGAALLGVASSAAATPAPTVAVDAEAGFVTQAFGANAAGDLFYNRIPSIVQASPTTGAIRHADGSVTVLDAPLGGDGTVAADGALWMSDEGSLWRVAPDGARTEHPVVTNGTPSTSIGEVELGPDGRIWFIDPARQLVGSIAADGTGVATHPVTGPGQPSQLAPGVDGRMWLTRVGGGVTAVAADGTMTELPGLGRSATGLRATSLGLYAVTNVAVVRIAPDGAQTVIRRGTWSSLRDLGTADGWAWFESSNDVLAVSPSGRTATFAIEDAFHLPQSSDLLTLVPRPTGGFIGGYGGTVVEVPSAAVSETFSVSGQFVTQRGANWIRASIRGTTPGGSPLSGPLDVVLYGTFVMPEGFTLVDQQATVAARVQLVGGRATVDIPITPSLVRRARPGGTLHTSCCSISVRRPGTPGTPGLASWRGRIGGGPADSYYGPVVPSSTMVWLDAMSRGATGRGMDDAGIVYWAEKMAAGQATRTSVTQGVVGSAAYRGARVDDAYRRWFGRSPTASERSYWAERLRTGTTTSALDLGLAAKPAARDVLGTTNAKRGLHLARALHLGDGSGSSFAAKLDAGTPWATVVRDGYWSSSAKEKRLTEMGPRSAYTPSQATLASQWQRTGDERAALIAILATLPVDPTFYV